MVAQSREISGIIALLAAAAATYIFSPKIGEDLAGFMREVFRTDLSSKMTLGSAPVIGAAFVKAGRILYSSALPICLIGFALGALGSFAQIGSVFSFEPISPNLSKIDPISGIRKIFSLRQATDGIRLIFKITAVLIMSYLLMKNEIFQAPQYMDSEPGTLLLAYGHSAKVIFLSLVGVLTLFAAMDFFLQRYEFNKSLRMTKQEAKQEHKEREGDPQIKARIRSVQREMARRRMMQAVKKADVVVTNPTHIAVALAYQKDSMQAPKVVAKGADLVAQKIKEVAQKAGVPMVENVPLARTLFRTVKLGQYVPRVLYQAVAEVLAYVYRLKNRNM